jgi:hypothetical protein
MSDYSEECADSLVSGQEYVDHEYNQYFDYTSDKSTDDSYRNRRSGPGGGKNAKFDDAGYNKIPRSTKGKNQNVFIEYYETSANPHVYIRDAISGATRSPYRTGTADEDLFFTVRLATGESRTRGGSNLFYDSPEQYERHFQVELPNEFKEAWREKARLAQIRYNQKADEAKKQKEILVK